MSETALAPSSGQTIEDPERRPKGRSVRPLLRLWPFLAAYKGMLAGALFALVAATAATLVVPLAVRQMIDKGFSNENAALVDQYFLLMMLVALVLGVASGTRFFFVTWLGERVVADLRAAVYKHITKLSPAFYETTRTGEVLSRLVADTTLIKTVVGSSASVALRNGFMSAGALVMMVVTSPYLSAMVILPLPVMMLPLILFGRLVRSLSRKSQDTIADTSALAGEVLNSIQTVQAFNQEANEQLRYAGAVERAFAVARRRIAARGALTAVMIFLVFAAVVGILWAGAQDVLSSEMSGGELGQFILYAVFAAGGLGALSEVWGEIQLAAGAAERLSELLDVEPQIKDVPHPLPLPAKAEGRIAFDGVTFSYPTRPDHKALDQFSLEVKPGETVALVGPSGAGKSTVFQLLMRFYDPASGSVRVDGVDVAQAPVDDVRRRLAVVPQETVVFGTTIAENIRYGRPEASRAEIEAAAMAARAHEFIEALPDGYDTPLGERGVNLSGGQRQRIAIARAVLRNAPILLLDEATSALDAESERAIQTALEELMVDRTTLVIAHRLATVLKADRIVVMDHGRIVAEGKHEELVAGGGLYARLAQLQFGEQAAGRAGTIMEGVAPAAS